MTQIKSEACELFIEQEIDSALERGNNPNQIGKELAQWVFKLFEVKIKSKTIGQRARRKQKNQFTNVNKKSQPIESTPDIIKNRKPQGGGKRKGAGRPKIERPTIEVRQMMEKFHDFVNALDFIKGRGAENLTAKDRELFDKEFKTLVPRLLRILDEIGFDIKLIMTNYVEKIKGVKNGKIEQQDFRKTIEN